MGDLEDIKIENIELQKLLDEEQPQLQKKLQPSLKLRFYKMTEREWNASSIYT